MNISTIRKTGLILLFFISLSCNKEVVNVYEIDRVDLYGSASEKKNLKNDEQFIAILFRDLFNESIGSDEMEVLFGTYASVGDKPLIIDEIIKSLLSQPEVEIATMAEMRNDPDGFVNDVFERFLIRKPTAQELWFLETQIAQNPDLKPVDIYYALLTSQEYRYYWYYEEERFFKANGLSGSRGLFHALHPSKRTIICAHRIPKSEPRCFLSFQWWRAQFGKCT